MEVSSYLETVQRCVWLLELAYSCILETDGEVIYMDHVTVWSILAILNWYIHSRMKRGHVNRRVMDHSISSIELNIENLSFIKEIELLSPSK